MKKKKQKKFKLTHGLPVVLITAIIAILCLVGWYAHHHKINTKAVQPATTKTTAQTPKTDVNTAPPQTPQGTITGTPSYPSEGLPADEKVCAVNITNTALVYCDNIGQRQTKPTCSVTDTNCQNPPLVKFSIKVPAGEYYVYATAEKELPNYKAYYDQFAACGNSVNCSAEGHKQYIKVAVTANAVIDNVDPSDWYAQ